MIRKLIGSIVVGAYPRKTRRARGAEMVDTLLDASEDSHRAFLSGCASLVRAGLNERGRHGARLAPASLVVLSCAVATAIVLTAGGGPAPTVGGSGRVPAAWLWADRQAIVLASSHDAACRASAEPRQSGSQQLLESAPTAELSSLLAVLRQPAPAAERVSAQQLRRLHIYAQGIYIRYARRGVTDGITYYMIPAANVGRNPVPARCYAKQLAAFAGQAARLPAAQRSQAIAWERRLVKQSQGPDPGIALITVGGGGVGGQYLTADRLRNNPWPRGGSGSNKITETALVVPDTVASVTAHYAAQHYPGQVSQPVTVTRRATDNLVVFVFRGAWDPPSLTYRSAAGTVLQSTPTG